MDLRRIINLVEAAAKAVPDYDIQAKYDKFNAAYFGGELPKVHLGFADLKSMTGVVKCQIVRHGPAPDPRLVRLGRLSKYHNCVIGPKGQTLQLSTRFLRSEEDLDSTLLHEMIHVYFNHIGDFAENHGSKFLRKLREISVASGIRITVTDKATDLELSNKLAAKAFGVLILRKKEGGVSFSIMSPKMAHEKKAEIEAAWNRRTGFASVTLYTIATPKWTEMAAKFPVARKIDGGLYLLKDEEALTDIEENGHVLFTRTPK